ncbi:TetR/AcrR family transcriptional regulator [Nocardiopsis dassonvillei]|uniref:TetR/AcrR family transcriptional regulator n=1 Tax=Nocardiopsis dassonvillei TaxID=2014 RepID=UPI0020A60CC4|nr:TetR/AcrR family transcriptional regulator [Nocardiopsis dassonvillei]MCP3013864.1 TetR/AcrR family transcriptional regulator [Nocardiopsis dassonvillei]
MQKASGTTARERILETAARLFYAQGIRAVGVDTVVSEANVAKATLYAHFRSKNDLIEAYLRREAVRAQEEIQHIETVTSPGPERVGALFDHAASAADLPGYQGCCFINAAAEHLDPDSRVVEVVAENRRVLLDYLTDNVDHSTHGERAAAARIVLTLFDGAKVASVSEGGAAFRSVRQTALELASSTAAAWQTAG